MASRKEYEMLFQLDAKLGSSYTSTFSKAKSGPSELQKEIRSLQSVQADISAYTKQQAAVEKTQAKLDNLNKQYQLLQQEIKETSGPTTSLERESAKLEYGHQDEAHRQGRNMDALHRQCDLDGISGAVRRAENELPCERPAGR